MVRCTLESSRYRTCTKKAQSTLTSGSLPPLKIRFLAHLEVLRCFKETLSCGKEQQPQILRNDRLRITVLLSSGLQMIWDGCQGAQGKRVELLTTQINWLSQSKEFILFTLAMWWKESAILSTCTRTANPEVFHPPMDFTVMGYHSATSLAHFSWRFRWKLTNSHRRCYLIMGVCSL